MSQASSRALAYKAKMRQTVCPAKKIGAVASTQQQQVIMVNYRSHRIYKPQLIRPATWTCDEDKAAQVQRRWRHES